MTDKQLLCPRCARRVMDYPDTMDPQINSLFVEGHVKPRNVPGIVRVVRLETGRLIHEEKTMLIRCDSCGRELEKGDIAVAWSAWPKGTTREAGWEDELLTDMRVVKEQIRDGGSEH